MATARLLTSSTVYPGLPDWVLALLTWAPSLSFVAGYFLSQPTGGIQQQPATRILLALVVAQVVILGLAMLLVVQRSPISRPFEPNDVVDIAMAVPVFWYTPAVFVLSIGFDLALLFNTTLAPSQLFTGSIMAAFGVAFSALGGLLALLLELLDQHREDPI